MRPVLMPMIAGGLALAALAAPSVAAAAPILTGFAGVSNSGSIGSCGEPRTETKSSAVSLAMTCGDRFGVLTSTAFAEAGHVGATASAATFGGTSTPAAPVANATYSDFLMFTSSDPNATEAEVSVNLFVDGVLNAAGGDPSVFTQAVAAFDAFVVLTGRLDIRESLKDDGSLFAQSNFGLVSGVLGPAPHGVVRSPTVIVPLNQLVFFEIGLEVGSGAVGPGASARSEFGHTFALPTGMDVFNLADGVTVNAGDYLVNNRYFDPALVSAGVPDPAGWALMITGLGLVGATLRRRTGRSFPIEQA
ncbi:PEPxxWA-CTERM sorting domain-containing protein [Phenylobacterium sp.]|uniref:PEPxxWA-CTERM sorting domain-containing protein n=1 Tax=Phenylobacterium sp. TaxID=1871053 RepID=UPI0025F10AFA|nr:PEPxxWA-CTERM sorting domain-containing protein [Phenylobacterium sp.]